MSYAERIAQELQDRAMPIGETDGLHRITAEADAEIAALRARVEALEAALHNLCSFHNFRQLDKGIGTKTPDGTAWLEARALLEQKP